MEPFQGSKVNLTDEQRSGRGPQPARRREPFNTTLLAPLRSAAHRLVAAAALGCLACHAAGGCATTTVIRPETVSFATRQYTLPSGLRVLIEEDPSAPLVGAVWVVDVGHTDDPPAHPGLAHTVEHLVFEAPDASGASAWQRLYDNGVTSVNATTELDQTVYETFGPRGQLDGLVTTELARMASPLGQVDDGGLVALLDKARAVIDEEGRVREDVSRARARHLLVRLFPADHPYGVAARQTPTPAPALPVGSVRAFARDHYRPERMTLVLTGAIPAAWDARLWAMLPAALNGDLQAPRLPQRRAVVADFPPPYGETRIGTETAPVAEPELHLGWRMPGTRGLGEVPFRILGEFVNRALAQALAAGRLPDVRRTAAATVINDRGSVLACVLTLRSGARAREARAQVIEVISQQLFLKKRAFVQARRLTLREIAIHSVFEMEPLPFRSLVRARLVHGGQDASIAAIVAAIEAVTPEDLSDLTSRYLTSLGARSVLLLPAAGEPPPTPAALAASAAWTTGSDDQSAAADSGGAPAPVPGPAQPSAALGPAHSPAEVRAVAGTAWAGAAQSARLANGLTVIALRRPGFPFVSVVLGFRSVASPDAPPGVDVAARFGRRYWNLATPLRHDMVAQTVTGQDNTRDEIRAYGSDAGHAIAHLADKVRGLTLRWPDTQFERWAAETTVLERQPESEAARSFAAALWGNHVYGLYTPVERVRQRSQADIAAWVNRTERPENGALVIVGDVDPAGMIKQAERELASAWRKRPAPAGAPEGAPPVPLNRRGGAAGVPVLFTRQPERRSAILHFGCLLPPVRTPRERAVDALLAQLLRDDLFERVRNREGKSYAPSVSWQHLWGGAASLEGFFDIERAAADQGVRALHDLLDQGGSPLFDPARIDRARWRLAVQGAEWQETNLVMARHLFAAWKNGWALSALDHYGDDLAGVSAGELQTALAACRASAVVSVLGPAAPPAAPPPPPAAAAAAAAAP